MISKRLVIFDMDGTLVDSEDFIVWSFMEVAKEMGLSISPRVVRECIGLPLDYVVERILPDVPVDIVERFIARRREIVSKYWRGMVTLFPDVKPALSYLKNNGFLLAVASSSVKSRIIEFLGYLGILDYFDYVSGVEEGVRGKPYPDVISRVLNMLGVAPGEAVYVGDRLVDCIAASSAGVDFILVSRGGFNDTNDKCNLIRVIKDLGELSTILSPPKSMG
ncbi:MAG: HAD family hydrolase [Desulfurococcaceae archaeon]